MSKAAVEKAREIGRRLASSPSSIALRKAVHDDLMRRWGRPPANPNPQTEEKAE